MTTLTSEAQFRQLATGANSTFFVEEGVYGFGLLGLGDTKRRRTLTAMMILVLNQCRVPFSSHNGLKKLASQEPKMQTFKRPAAVAAHCPSAGPSGTFFIEGGQLWVCGYNDDGQPGLGDNEDRNTFTRVNLSERVSQVAAGGFHTALITERGQLWVCG